MTNGDLLDEVELLLSKKQLPTASALRLMLKMQKQQFETLAVLTTEQGDLKVRMDNIERISIVRWVGNHPKATGLIASCLVFVTSYVDIRELIKYVVALGTGAGLTK